jgi:tmRNA-binding protein
MSQEGVSDKWVDLVNTLWSLDKDNWKKRDPKRGKKILLSSNEIADVKRIYLLENWKNTNP